jgi:hypothetical protein
MFDYHKVLVSAVAGGILLVATACGSPAISVPGSYPNITLAASKSPVQLLRNDVVNRLDATTVFSLESAGDESAACLKPDVDPQETIRSWLSSALITLKAGVDPKAVFDNLVASYGDIGWKADSLGDSTHYRSTLLTKSDSVAEIYLTGEVPRDYVTDTSEADKLAKATITVSVHGPCVRTEGANSDEIKTLTEDAQK